MKSSSIQISLVNNGKNISRSEYLRPAAEIADKVDFTKKERLAKLLSVGHVVGVEKLFM